MCTCFCVGAYTRVFGGQKTTSVSLSAPLDLTFPERHLSLGQELTDWLDKLAKVPPVSTSPVLGLKERTAAPGFL